jgi:hypothetical protein
MRNSRRRKPFQVFEQPCLASRFPRMPFTPHRALSNEMADATAWQPVWALLASNASAIAKQSLAYLEAWIQLDPLVSAVHVRFLWCAPAPTISLRLVGSATAACFLTCYTSIVSRLRLLAGCHLCDGLVLLVRHQYAHSRRSWFIFTQRCSLWLSCKSLSLFTLNPSSAFSLGQLLSRYG